MLEGDLHSAGICHSILYNQCAGTLVAAKDHVFRLPQSYRTLDGIAMFIVFILLQAS